MSASVESNENPHVVSDSPVVTSIANIFGDELNDRGYIQSYVGQHLIEVGAFYRDPIGRSIHHNFSDPHRGFDDASVWIGFEGVPSFGR